MGAVRRLSLQLVNSFPSLTSLELSLCLSSAHSLAPLAPLSQSSCKVIFWLKDVPDAPPGSPDQAEELLRLLQELHALPAVTELWIEAEQLNEIAQSSLASHTGLKCLTLELRQPLSQASLKAFCHVEELDIFEAK